MINMNKILQLAGPAIFENSHQGNALVSKDGYFLCVNRAFCDVVGYSEPELLNKRWQEITRQDDVSTDEQSADRVSVGRLEGYVMEKRYISKYGKEIRVKMAVNAVKDENGDFVCFVAMVCPMDERMPAHGVVITTNDLGKLLRTISWSVKNAPWIAGAIIALFIVGSKLWAFFTK